MGGRRPVDKKRVRRYRGRDRGGAALGDYRVAGHSGPLPVCLRPILHPRASGFYGEEGEVTNDRVMLVEHNWDALIHRLRLIEGAKERIILSTFDFHDDDSGQDVMAALVAAAERGWKSRSSPTG